LDVRAKARTYPMSTFSGTAKVHQLKPPSRTPGGA
jgi:hypothetical protein